jgi:hypothetical protein
MDRVAGLGIDLARLSMGATFCFHFRFLSCFSFPALGIIVPSFYATPTPHDEPSSEMGEGDITLAENHCELSMSLG